MVEVPIQIIEIETDSYHIIVSALCDGKAVNLLIDTGASKSVFDKDSELCEGLVKIHLEQEQSFSINQTIKEYGQVCFPVLQFGESSFKNVDFTLIDFSFIHEVYRENTNVLVDGILGGDFLLENKAAIDYGKKVIRLIG